MYDPTVIRSHDAVNTTNVHFVVHPGGSLAFDAKAVILARDEDSELPLVQTSGDVLFNVKGWSDAYTDGGIEDKGKVVEVLQGGNVYSTHTLHYTPTKLAVANKEARDNKGEKIQLSPVLEKMLQDFHAGKRSPSDGTRKNGGSSDPSDETLHSVGVIAAIKASRENAEFPELTAEYRVSSRVTHARRLAISKRDTNSAATATTATAETTADVKPGVPPAPTHSASDNPSSASSSSSSSSSASSSFSPSFSSSPRNYHWVKKPDHSLPVGEGLTGFMKSEDGTSVAWPGVDASLRYGVFETPDADNEFGVGSGVIRPTTLIVSDSQKAREALLLRKELRDEAGGGGEEKEAKTGGSWWSWRGSPKRREREVAAENAGEVCITVTNRGCIQGTVDGTVVFSESGPSKWGWINRRPVDEGYELHVTDTGVEVRLEGRTIWGINAD